MSTQWYCKIMGDQWGPMSSREMLAVARRGRLSRDDLVRRGQDGTWIRAELVGGLFNAPPPAPTAEPKPTVESPHRPVPAKRSLNSKHMPQFWIMRRSVVIGPVSAGRLRELAADGQLQPDHLVTNDRRRWVPASRVKGLSFRAAPNEDEVKTASIRSALLFDSPFRTIPEEMVLMR